MSTIFQPTRLVGAIAIAMGFSSTTFAQDQSNDKTATLDTIVVTASRSEEKIENVPASITVIDHKLIEKNPIFNLSDIILDLNTNQPKGNILKWQSEEVDFNMFNENQQHINYKSYTMGLRHKQLNKKK